MCGIVGILGTGPVAGSIVDALKRLEYRGYDSAGVATLENGRLERRRAEGKLKNLEAKLAAAPLGGAIGIGHTRWATHGKPTETNAHPHASPRLAVVHNGIIENFRALRQELAAKGHAFATETNSEIAAFVVEDELDKGKSPASRGPCGARPAARGLCARLSVRGRGGSPDRRAPGRPAGDRLWRRGNVSGLGRAGAQPLHRPHRLSRGGRLGRLTRKGAEIREASGARVKRPIQRSPAGSLLAEKGNYRHFMAKEIHEQPEVVGHTLARYIDMGALKLKPFAWPADPTRLTRVTIVGCGTAYIAGLVAKYWIERWARLPVEIDVASEYRYREAPVDDGGLTIVVSQSGETADTLASLRYVKERGRRQSASSMSQAPALRG